MTSTTKAPAAFAWDEKNVAAAAELYLALGKDVRNTKPELAKIAAAVGAKSAQSVMSKLVSEGVYEKSDAPTSTGGTATQKCQIVNSVETILSLKKGSLGTLGKANKQELQMLVDALIKTSDIKAAEEKPAEDAAAE